MPFLFRIGGVPGMFRAKSSPAEIRLADYVSFLEHVHERKPPVVAALEKVAGDEAKEREVLEAHPDADLQLVSHYLDEIRFFTDVPDDLLGSMPFETVLEIHDLVVRVANAMQNPNPCPGLRFQAGGEWFYFPKPGKEEDGSPRPMAYSTVQEFFEAFQWKLYGTQVAGGDFARIPEMLAVLCRKQTAKGREPLPLDSNELDEFTMARAELFKRELHMDVASFGAFFLTMPFVPWTGGPEPSAADETLGALLMKLVSVADTYGVSSASSTTSAPSKKTERSPVLA